MPPLEYLTELKNFLADRPEWAFLTISVVTNVWLLKKLLAEKDAHFATVERWLPATEQLSQLLAKAAAKARLPKRTEGENNG